MMDVTFVLWTMLWWAILIITGISFLIAPEQTVETFKKYIVPSVKKGIIFIKDIIIQGVSKCRWQMETISTRKRKQAKTF